MTACIPTCVWCSTLSYLPIHYNLRLGLLRYIEELKDDKKLDWVDVVVRCTLENIAKCQSRVRELRREEEGHLYTFEAVQQFFSEAH